MSKNATNALSYLLADIAKGDIALPEIQRPFVWKPRRVRDLFDSMYRGFPVGNLLFWRTGAESGARKIGLDAQETAPRLMIVDGQQRLTSLYSVLEGKEVLDKDYKTFRIRIAFRPRDMTFAVTDAAVERDPEFIPDISVLWHGNVIATVRGFIGKLEASKGELDDDSKDAMESAIFQLYNLRDYNFTVVELRSDIDPQEVAEIFVRINSGGVQLNQSNFILTLMSVWWEKGRQQLEKFARDSRNPPKGLPSPANDFIDPTADQLLRVVAGLALRRARLRSVYQVLRGIDSKTRKPSPEIRKKQFAVMQSAQVETLNLNNWHEFFAAVRHAGYRSRKMISSNNSLLFSYLMYLIGRQDYELDRTALREVIARWFFMAALSGRYTGSGETRVESDIRRIAKAKSGEVFIENLDGLADTTLTGDYWKVQLPSLLATSSSSSPSLFAYHASLVLLDARPLFSPSTSPLLSTWFAWSNSRRSPRSPIERHYLFPKTYLDQVGFLSPVDRNQIGNYAFMEWSVNRKIADRAPREYCAELLEQLPDREQKQHRFWHALPDDWEKMEYPEFLQERRVLIAKVVRAAFGRLRTGRIPKLLRADPATPTVATILGEGETGQVEFKASAYHSYKKNVPPKVIMKSVLKTVAGFMNAEGGTLLLGVADDGEVLGIQPDLKKKNMDADRYVNSLTTEIERALGPFASTNTRIELKHVKGKQIAYVSVPASTEPVYAKVFGEPHPVFFVRMNNSTRILYGADLVHYHKKRWP